jgi:putative ABC transport system permease protein
MLMAIRERTNEIGLRMAVGASRKDILIQFLVEAAVLGVGGGAIGLIVGIGGAFLISLLTAWAMSIEVSAVLLAFGFSLAIGLFFGVYPARKASLLDPIVALRSE